jgi:hypothetical protein
MEIPLPLINTTSNPETAHAPSPTLVEEVTVRTLTFYPYNIKGERKIAYNAGGSCKWHVCSYHLYEISIGDNNQGNISPICFLFQSKQHKNLLLRNTCVYMTTKIFHGAESSRS